MKSILFIFTLHIIKYLNNMEHNLFDCLTLLPELHGQISKLQAPKTKEINNYSTVLLSTRDDRPGGTKGVHQSTPTIYSGIQSPEERNQVGNMGNCLLGFCLVNNNKQSG